MDPSCKVDYIDGDRSNTTLENLCLKNDMMYYKDKHKSTYSNSIPIKGRYKNESEWKTFSSIHTLLQSKYFVHKHGKHVSASLIWSLLNGNKTSKG